MTAITDRQVVQAHTGVQCYCHCRCLTFSEYYPGSGNFRQFRQSRQTVRQFRQTVDKLEMMCFRHFRQFRQITEKLEIPADLPEMLELPKAGHSGNSG